MSLITLAENTAEYCTERRIVYDPTIVRTYILHMLTFDRDFKIKLGNSEVLKLIPVNPDYDRDARAKEEEARRKAKLEREANLKWKKGDRFPSPVIAIAEEDEEGYDSDGSLFAE